MSKSKEESRVDLIYRPQPNAATFSPEYRPGETVSVPAGEAKRLLASGQFEKPAVTTTDEGQKKGGK